MEKSSRVKGSLAGTRYPSYREAQRESRDRRGGRWDYFSEPFLNADNVPVDDLEFINTQYPHTEGR